MGLQQTSNQDSSGNTSVTGTVSSSQSGTWTVQPGNTANTTAWLMNARLQDGAGTTLNSTSNALNVNVQNASLSTTSSKSTTGTLSSVAGSATSVTVLASNASRFGFAVYNDSTAVLKLAFASSASATAFTVLLQPNAYYENNTLYTGIITGIWASATGNARVTELT